MRWTILISILTLPAILDHFLVSESLLPLIETCQVLHGGDNLSRHSPMLLKLRVGEIPIRRKDSTWKPKKPAWHKVT